MASAGPDPSARSKLPGHNGSREDRVHRGLRDPQAPVLRRFRPTSSRPRSTASPRATRARRACPGFRPGKVPAHVVRQRYKDQILHDVAHDLIPRARRRRRCTSAASSRSPTPDIKDVVLEEGQPLTFVADFETMPPIDPGDYTGLTLRKPPAVLEVGAVDHALEQLQQRAARWHPVEDRPAAAGDTLLLDLTRTRRDAPDRSCRAKRRRRRSAGRTTSRRRCRTSRSNSARTANPPGLRRAPDRRVGRRHARRSPSPTRPTTRCAELAGATVDYAVTVKGIRRKELLPLDDDFAKEVSDARDARRAARRASARTCSRTPSTTPTTRCGTICCSELSRPRRRPRPTCSSSRRSIGGSRSSCAG